MATYFNWPDDIGQKVSNMLKLCTDVHAMCFDKTGTLTVGRPRVHDIVVVPDTGVDERELLRVAASVEARSEHPLAAAVVAASLARVTEVFDWDEAALLRGTRVTQQDLFSSSFGKRDHNADKMLQAKQAGIHHPLSKKEQEPVTPKPKVTDKKLSLDDFF